MDQRISYAESALESGDKDAQKDAYNAIKDNDDPEVQLLASKVAVGASGINDAIADATDALLAGESYTAQDLKNNVDVTMLQNSMNSFDQADGNTTITSDEYLVAAASQAIIDTTTNDFSDINFSDTTAGTPGYYLDKSGYTEDEIISLVSN
jgi:hypothetical protein